MPIVDISEISVGLNRRPLKEQKVAELMESIKVNGLLNPITVDQHLNLIAGLHRLTAYKLLGLDQIECNIIVCEDANHVRLAEIDENLIRSELDALERAELWLQRDQILKQLGLRARPGDNQYTQKGSEMIAPPPRTTLELAKEAGYTKRTFQQGKQIARSIDPKVKELIKGTPIAQSPTALLKVARAGSNEDKQAAQAEKAAQEAKAKRKQAEAERQAQIAAEARARKRELQLIALYSNAAEREAKLAGKRVQDQAQQQAAEKPAAFADLPKVQVGDEWLLEQHLVFCGDTAGKKFRNCLPSNAALAIATPASTWNHDYLVDKAHVVAVLRSEGYIHEFCNRQQMPLRYELLIGNLYVAIFSHQSISRPQRPIEIEGVEGIVAYLVSLYTSQYNFVIAPFLGHGELLITCERMGRTCFAGGENPEQVSRAISRWQKWTGKQIKKMASD